MTDQLAPVQIESRFVIERQGRQMVLYSGLLDAAHRLGLRAIRTRIYQAPCKDNADTTIVCAEVELADGRLFSGIGDATPSNVGPNIRPHAIRMAETRAKARALRDAINVAMVSVEEVSDEDEPARPAVPPALRAAPSRSAPVPGLTAGSPNLAQARAVARRIYAQIHAHDTKTTIPEPPLNGSYEELRSYILTYRSEADAAENALAERKQTAAVR